MVQSCRGSRKSSADVKYSTTGSDSRQGAKYAKFGRESYIILQTIYAIFFPTFAALASLREIVRVSVAASPPWVTIYTFSLGHQFLSISRRTFLVTISANLRGSSL
jgi:hypothetical protein